MQYCQICKQDSEESMLIETLPCTHKISICLECIGETPDRCPECNPPPPPKKPAKIKSKTSKSCEDCNIFKEPEEMLIQTCKKTKLFYCLPCMNKKVDFLIEEKICHICHVNLNDIELIYYKKALKCGQHSTQICGKCTVILENDFLLGCYKCNLDFTRIIKNPKLKPCILCLKLIKGNMSIGPLACDSLKKHKFPICTDCVICMKSSSLICRYCVVKKEKHFTFAQPLKNNIFNSGLLSLKISLNELGQQLLFQDPENASQETSFILKPFLFESELIMGEGIFDYAANFLPGMSVVAQGTKHLFTGGLHPISGTSSFNCSLVKYEMDGRFKNFKLLPCSSLVKRRHGHCSYYCEKQMKGWVFGGVCVANPNEMEFLSSIESFQCNDMDMKLDDSWEGMNWKTEKKLKMKVARTGASLYNSGNKVYLVGGYSDIAKPERSIEMIDLVKGKSSLLNSGIPNDLSSEVLLIELSNQNLLVISKDLHTFQIDFENDILLGKDQYRLEGLKSWVKPHKMYSTKIKDKILLWGGSVFYKEPRENAINGFKCGILDEDKKIIVFTDVFGGIKDLDLEVFSNVFGDIYQGMAFEFQKRNVN